MAAPWRVARALEGLRGELNARYPDRDLGSDGGIGDGAHQSEGSASDHNPWITLDGVGIVTARDFDVDLTADGTASLAAMLALVDVIATDARVKYVIFEGRINYADGKGWRPYFGVDPHTSHAHVSVKGDPAYFDDTRPWLTDLGLALAEDDEMTPEDRKLLNEVRRMLACVVNPSYAAANGAPGEYRIADQVLMLGQVPVRPYRGQPEQKYPLMIALSELLELGRTIRDAVELVTAQLGDADK